MKALVLSGGMGTRLRPLTYSTPKQLIPVAGKAVLEHVIDNILAAGITEIGMVVGGQGDKIREVIGDGGRFGARITYIPQDQPLGLAHCVKIARDFLGDDDFLMYLGDNVLPEGVAGIAGSFAAHRPAAQLVVQKVADPRAFGVAEVDEDFTVTALAEKPEVPRSNLALIGVYFFTPAIHTAVDAIRPSARGELEITDAVQWLVANGATVKASEYLGFWADTGNVDAVLECNRRLLDELPPQQLGTVDAASRVDDSVVLAAGCRVVNSRIEGPAYIGPGSVVEDSHIGRYTAIGADCSVRHTLIEDSIVQDGSTLSDLPGLSGSLIGRTASVSATRRHRLIVGDDSRVEVAT
ncbi:glucose-1-phosphate thymidylyltransferase [Streptomyces sp. LHD-70]|uniref:glucose-1-phosphate thymidylyltransferase n=1 Tax=Streptomyces sp. LHD-70 TaxID=3072140 RepID=UPI00280DD507|nr:glucose-1-phosphate thymidylyltransferase [Streptomyces sp. LHD-70]MDQ8707292.1 glucose-1-phosphate thymidylyltransferase [Streptomyces sp. LHD-70]